MIFVDTSAVLAILDTNNEQYGATVKAWNELLDAREQFVTTSYVVVELFSLAQARFGLGAVRVFEQEVAPLLEIVWVDPDIHHAAVAAVFAAGRRNLSLVDCASFEVMRRKGLRTAFTLDRRFAEQGFAVIP